MAEEHKKHSEHKEKHKAIHHKKKIKKIVVWQWLTVILAVILIASIFTGGFKGTTTKMGAKAAANKVLNFINTNLVQPGTEAKLVSVKEVNGIYEITTNYQNREIPIYTTKDGKLLIQGVTNIDEFEAPASQETTSAEIPKTAKPKVDLYVMSFCPYGNRAEDTMLPVYEALKDNVEWNIRYIVSVAGDNIISLHGQPETDQNIREVCVKNNYGLDKFWQFVTYVNQNCGSDGSCWKDAAKETGIDADKIQECYDNEGIELMKEEAEASNSAGASGSPTLIINGVISNSVYQYGNPEAYKQAICSAFSDAPEECSDVLASDTQVSAGGSC